MFYAADEPFALKKFNGGCSAAGACSMTERACQNSPAGNGVVCVKHLVLLLLRHRLNSCGVVDWSS
jgi:hypothetical protein